MNRRLILSIALSVLSCAMAFARELQDSVFINFRQSKIYLDTLYMDNERALQHAIETINYYHQPDSNFVLTNVKVVGGASPEGSVKFNEWLARRRAERIFQYIGERFELPDSLTSFTFLDRDWGGLRRMVLADPNVPYRDEVLALLDEIIATNIANGGFELESSDFLNRMKRLRGFVPYQYMYDRLFPTLRASKLVLTFTNPRPEPMRGNPTLPALPAFPFRADVALNPMVPSVVVPPVRPLKPFYMDIRTNLLFDALAVPNIGAEFYLGKNLSIVGNWGYAWYKCDHRARYWRIYGGDLALRWWFGAAAHQKPLQGHHVGLYGGLVTYDFEWGGTGYMGGIPRGTLWDRCNHYFGAEYGYSLPVSKRLNIDFTIGLGYLGGEYQVYDPQDGCYVYRETRRRHFWGPTKAEITLAWLIGRGNYNKKWDKKGGAL